MPDKRIFSLLFLRTEKAEKLARINDTSTTAFAAPRDFNTRQSPALDIPTRGTRNLCNTEIYRYPRDILTQFYTILVLN
jgi:hypothetical protein